MKSKVGDNISMVTSGWTFNDIDKKFDQHIIKSVPFYLELHKIALKLSEFFISNQTRILDIGCSTGTFLIDLSKKYPKKSYNLKFLGIDPVQSMIKNAKLKNKDKRIKFLKRSIFEIKSSNFDYITAILTLQFIPLSQRQKAYDIIYKSLNVGGGFFIFEKTRAEYAKNEEINVGVYNDFKRENGFSEKEINQKALSLRGKMECNSPNENMIFLKNSGFKKIFKVFKWFGFEGVLCIK